MIPGGAMIRVPPPLGGTATPPGGLRPPLPLRRATRSGRGTISSELRPLDDRFGKLGEDKLIQWIPASADGSGLVRRMYAGFFSLSSSWIRGFPFA